MLTAAPDNRRSVRLLFALYFSFGIAYVATDTAAYMLFIRVIGADRLPLTYIGIAVMLSLLGTGYLRFERLMPLRRLLLLATCLAIVVTIACVIGLIVNPGEWLIFLLPVWSYTLINLSNVVVWNLAGSILTLRQSKGQYGLINAGRWSAAALTGLLASALVGAFGAVSLIVLALIALVVALGIVNHLTRHLQHDAPLPASSSTLVHGKQERIWELPFVRAIIGIITGMVLVMFLINNLFYEISARNFLDTESLAQAIGTTTALAGMSALLLNLFAVGPIVKRFGLQMTLYIAPALALAGVSVVSIAVLLDADITILFALAVIMRTVMVGFFFSLDYAGSRVAFQVLAAAVRARLNALIEGFIEPIAVAVVGFLLIVLQVLGLDYRLQVVLVIGALIIWSWRIRLLTRLYPLTLAGALKRRAFREEGLIVDASSMALLRETLHSPYPEAVLYALDLLDDTDDPALVTNLVPLFNNPTSLVRLQALTLVEKRELRTALPEVRRLLETDADPSVREKSLHTLSALGEEVDFERVVAALHDPTLRRGAMIALMRTGRLDGVIRAGEKLLSLLDSPSAIDRQTAAQVFGAVGIRNYYQPILRLMSDIDPQVRITALAAAGKIRHPHLWAGVTEGLLHPETRGAAFEAFVEGGADSLPHIQNVVAQPETAYVVRLMLLRACGRIDHPDATALLETQLNTVDLPMRSQVLSCLRSKSYHPASPDRVLAQVQAEVAQAATALAAHDALGTLDAAGLLRSGLWRDFERLRDNALIMLSFIFSTQAILQAREALLYGSAAQHNFALEVIETSLPADLRQSILALWETLPTKDRLKRLAPTAAVPTLTPNDWLDTLVSYPHDWIRTCATYTSQLVGHRAFQHTDTSLIEHVILLKRVGIFADTPDAVLAQVAGLLQPITLTAGEVLFEKGDMGSSLYIISSGVMRVYDGDFTLDERREGDVFGEMALLDPEPRIASVMATADSQLLRLDQGLFYDLMAERIEVVRGMLRVLIGTLRTRVRDVSVLREQERALKKGAVETDNVPL